MTGKNPWSAEDARHLVRRYYSCADHQDLPTMFSLFDERLLYKRPGHAALVDKATFMDFYRSGRIIDVGAHSLRAITVENDRVVVQGSFRETSESGAACEIEFADVFTVKDGKISELHTYFDREAI